MGIGIVQIVICVALIYVLYKAHVIADKISVNKNKLRVGLVAFFILVFFQNTSFATILFWLLFSGTSYILYKPDIVPNKMFYNSQTKTYTWAGRSKVGKRVFILLCSMFTVLPFYLWMSNENYKEREFERLAEEERIRDAEAEKAEEERKKEERNKKIRVLEESGISNVLLFGEQEQDRLFDSIENKNCREEWMKKLYDDFGVRRPNLRKGVENYNINQDCDYAMDLHTDLQIKAWEKERKSEAKTIRQMVRDYKKLGLLGANQKYAKNKFDLKNCKILQISDWSNWTGYTIHLYAGSSDAVNCNMDYQKTEGAEILSKLRVGSRVNLNAVVDGSQVDVSSWGDVTIRLENGVIW